MNQTPKPKTVKQNKRDLRKCSPSGCDTDCDHAVRSYCKPKAKAEKQYESEKVKK